MVASSVVRREKSRVHEVIDMRMDLVGSAGGDAAVGCGRAAEPMVASSVVRRDKSRHYVRP
jgi:hypothetical protein